MIGDNISKHFQENSNLFVLNFNLGPLKDLDGLIDEVLALDSALGAALFGENIFGALGIPDHRQRRAAVSVDVTDAAFSVLAAQEPAQCYRRLICFLATVSFEKSENDVIVSLFNKGTSIDSVTFEFTNAAKLGKQWKSVQKCELRYSCPLSGKQIQHIMKIQANSLTNSQLT